MDMRLLESLFTTVQVFMEVLARPEWPDGMATPDTPMAHAARLPGAMVQEVPPAGAVARHRGTMAVAVLNGIGEAPLPGTTAAAVLKGIGEAPLPGVAAPAPGMAPQDARARGVGDDRKPNASSLKNAVTELRQD